MACLIDDPGSVRGVLLGLGSNQKQDRLRSVVKPWKQCRRHVVVGIKGQ